MSVQAFAAQLAVERFDERIVCGLARAGEVQDHTALVIPRRGEGDSREGFPTG